MLRGLTTTVALIAVLGGCASPQATAADALSLGGESGTLRELQTRRFETEDESGVLRASTALLQDLGFSLDNAEPAIGLIAASKQRTALDPLDATLAILGTIWFSTSPAMIVLRGGDTIVEFDTQQHMSACLVTRPDENGVLVRITFQRTVRDNTGRVSAREPLQDPEQYEEFFDRLSKSVFLQAHDL